ncbi:Transmembrane and immunoglobulin domain-containing protein 1 [Lemmus lemmus]
MVWKIMGLLQACRFLLVIVSLPQGRTSSVVTVNGRTENYILDTSSGAQASLECAVQNHTSDEELLWYREDGIVDLKTGNKINTSSVCVSPVREDDDGVRFTCKLQSDQTVSVSVVLNVTCEWREKKLPILGV